MTPAARALNRFGLGARPDEPTLSDPQGWLVSQLGRYEPLPASWEARPRTVALVEVWNQMQRATREAPADQRSGVREAYLREARKEYQAAAGARIASALQTPTPFLERLVHFWSNHFAVSVDKLAVVGMAGSFEADAIRPHVLGRFEDLLLAAIRHPAMLVFLDQAQSTGPRSLFARRAEERQQRGRGLNENLAREIMELHTLGVRSGYTQDDVTEFARALTGWTIAGEAGTAKGESFRFVPALHEPGARSILGRSYPDDGEAQARAVIRDVVGSPATARHVALKLARQFIAEDPPEAVVARLAQAFTRTEGDLSSVYRELVASPETWQAAGARFKSPWDWMVSGARAIGRREIPPTQAANMMVQLGQPIWRPGSPAGYVDSDATWAAPDALMRRVEIAQRLAREAGNALDVRSLAPRILPGELSKSTASAIARADSASTALALLLVSPEFLRR